MILTSSASEKAMEMGIPYQTIISGIIHRYIEGDPKKRADNDSLQRYRAKESLRFLRNWKILISIP